MCFHNKKSYCCAGGQEEGRGALEGGQGNGFRAVGPNGAIRFARLANCLFCVALEDVDLSLDDLVWCHRLLLLGTCMTFFFTLRL